MLHDTFGLTIIAEEWWITYNPIEFALELRCNGLNDYKGITELEMGAHGLISEVHGSHSR